MTFGHDMPASADGLAPAEHAPMGPHYHYTGPTPLLVGAGAGYLAGGLVGALAGAIFGKVFFKYHAGHGG